MKITTIKINNYGPFSTPTFIEFEPDFTVFTGANDSGKTSILNLIEMLWTRGKITEDEANIDRTITATVPWDQDTDITAGIDFKATSNTNKFFKRREIIENSIIHVNFCFSPNNPIRQLDFIQNGDSRINFNQPLDYHPVVVLIAQDTPKINPIINLEKPNLIEQKLLSLAFGQNPLPKFAAMNAWKLANSLEIANHQLNTALSKVVPKNINYEVRFQKAEGVNYFGLTLLFRDSFTGSAPIHLRGAGIRKLVSLACTLLDRNFENQFNYVLVDEPENSLHADAQHTFRRFLEELGKKENIQVIYATHSPAMINPLKGNHVRLVSREIQNEFATTKVNNHPYNNNFLSVRTSLGMSLADSLLFGPVTIVTEGHTEVCCLPIILERMLRELPDEFGELAEVLPMLLILDGQGDSFNYWCSLVKQQGSEAILFVDGDKLKRVNHEKASGKLKDVPVVSLERNREFEDLVPIDIYFTALKGETGEQKISLEHFEAWLDQKAISPQMMFSKRVDYWLSDEFPDVYYDKPGVMRYAIKNCEISKIVLDPFRDLIDQIYKKIHP